MAEPSPPPEAVRPSDPLTAIPFSQDRPAARFSDDQQTSIYALLEIESLTSLLEQLGFNTEDGSIWSMGAREFEALTGDGGADLSVDPFVMHASSRWGMKKRTAQAVFFASDISGSAGCLELNEYLLLRAAFVEPPDKDHIALWLLQLRATFHRFSMSDASWDDAGRKIAHTIKMTGQGVPMTRADVHYWMEHMLVAETFVETMTGTFFSDEEMDRGVNEIQFIRTIKAVSGGGTNLISLLSRTLERVREVAQERESMLRSGAFRLATRGALLEEVDERGRSAKVVLADRAISSYIPGSKEQGASATKPEDCKQAEDAKKPQDAKKPEADEKGGKVERAMVAVKAEEVPHDAFNDDFEVDENRRPYGDWRGPLACAWNEPEAVKVRRVVDAAMSLARQLLNETDKMDRSWLNRGEARAKLLGETEEEQAETMLLLARRCRRLLMAEPSMLRVSAPAKVFGDLHGQLRELLLFFGHFGMPTQAGGDILSTKYIFNGDWIDRGAHQLEVVAVLFALKVLFPSHIFLLRGNHELRDMSKGMKELGFYAYMLAAMPTRGEGVFEAIHKAFDWLPIAALVNSSILVLHGGLGAGTWGLRDLEMVKRPLLIDRPEDQQFRVVLDALWADPADSDAAMRAGVHLNWERHGFARYGGASSSAVSESEGKTVDAAEPAAEAEAADAATSIEGIAPEMLGSASANSQQPLEDSDSVRLGGPEERRSSLQEELDNASHPGKTSAILEWGADITRAFCERENVQLIIRSHQFVPYGYKYMHGGRLITLFSARNYFETIGNERPNDGAILLLATDVNGHLRVHPLRIKHVEVPPAKTLGSPRPSNARSTTASIQSNKDQAQAGMGAENAAKEAVQACCVLS